MAETVHLFLKSNGVDVPGDSSQTSLGRADSIECLYFTDSVRTAREKGSGVATGRRTYEPIIFTKRIDKSSPLLAKALCNNENIEGVFRFYRPSPLGDGTTEQFFTVEISGGRISHIKRVSPDAIDPASLDSAANGRSRGGVPHDHVDLRGRRGRAHGQLARERVVHPRRGSERAAAPPTDSHRFRPP